MPTLPSCERRLKRCSSFHESDDHRRHRSPRTGGESPAGESTGARILAAIVQEQGYPGYDTRSVGRVVDGYNPVTAAIQAQFFPMAPGISLLYRRMEAKRQRSVGGPVHLLSNGTWGQTTVSNGGNGPQLPPNFPDFGRFWRRVGSGDRLNSRRGRNLRT
jgi:hypothetical protein